MKKLVVKGKKPRYKPRSSPMPSKTHKSKKRKKSKVEKGLEYEEYGFNPFMR
jgi:hypothetical protein